MCGLFGFMHYGDNSLPDLSDLTNLLARQSAERGKDAVGIAYLKNGKLTVDKYPKAAYAVTFRHPESVGSLMGHTRHATQGDASKNINNHPFCGQAGRHKFALAHNGILTNERDLRAKYRLRQTAVETDSFIAVQLLEKQKSLNADALKTVAEEVEGSYSFTVLDDLQNLYLIKGDSPITLMHFPKQQLYVYASTDEILFHALTDSFLLDALKRGDFTLIPLSAGDILTLRPDGKRSISHFQPSATYARYYPYPYGYDDFFGDGYDEYLDELRDFSHFLGMKDCDFDMLLEMGYSADEIEDYLYSYAEGGEAVERVHN